MKFDFNNIPVTTLVGSGWRSFGDIARGRTIDKGYRGRYYLTRFISLLILPFRAIDNLIYKLRFKKSALQSDPLFVLGHWRSGTTFVHNVLSCDKNFGYTTTYQTVFPRVMLFGQPMFKWVMKSIMPDKRPVDGLELKPDLPQEEEFALSNMMPYSYYNFWIFPRHMLEYCERYMLMNDITSEERERFESEFMHLVKVSLHNTGGTRYLSKNPPHTGRVKELLRIFPNAKFVYLMRNPYTVYESTRGFFTETIKPLQLQDQGAEALTADFVEVYKRLYDKYQEDKSLIPEGNLIEIKFEDFEADPMAMTERIYRELSLDGFEQARPAMESYVGSKRGHKKNNYKYAPETVEMVEKHWGRAIDDWGYLSKK